MGMFDWVKFEGSCPGCGKLLTSWQSKQLHCKLELIEPWQVSSFYTLCETCNKLVYADVDADIEVKTVVKRCDVTLRFKQDS